MVYPGLLYLPKIGLGILYAVKMRLEVEAKMLLAGRIQSAPSPAHSPPWRQKMIENAPARGVSEADGRFSLVGAFTTH